MAQAKISKSIIDQIEADPTRDQYIWDTTLKGFGLKVTKGGKKVYIAQYRLHGRKGRTRRVTIGDIFKHKPDEARAAAKNILAEVTLGTDVAQEKTDKRNEILVAELLHLWLAEGCNHKKPSTLATDKTNIERHIIPLLGTHRVSSLSRADIERMHNDVAIGKTAKTVKTGPRGLARIKGGRGAANRCLANIGAALTFAQNRGLIDHNPARGVKQFKLDSRERFLSREEMQRLWQALDVLDEEGENPYAVAALRILILTGCRKGEVLNLRWDEVDFERHCFRLPDSKTGKRTIIVADAVLDIIKGIKRIDGCPYVIASLVNNGPLINLQKYWTRVRADSGLEDVRLHDLRHSFASFAVAGGTSLYMVGKMLGHKQARTTEIYAHIADEGLRQTVNYTTDSLLKRLD